MNFKEFTYLIAQEIVSEIEHAGCECECEDCRDVAVEFSVSVIRRHLRSVFEQNEKLRKELYELRHELEAKATLSNEMIRNEKC